MQEESYETDSAPSSVQYMGALKREPVEPVGQIEAVILAQKEQKREAAYDNWNKNKRTKAYFARPDIRKRVLAQKIKAPNKKFDTIVKELDLKPEPTKSSIRTPPSRKRTRSRGSPSAMAFNDRLEAAGVPTTEFLGRTVREKQRLLKETIIGNSGLQKEQAADVFSLQKKLEGRTLKMFNDTLGQNGERWVSLLLIANNSRAFIRIFRALNKTSKTKSQRDHSLRAALRQVQLQIQNRRGSVVTEALPELPTTSLSMLQGARNYN